MGGWMDGGDVVFNHILFLHGHLFSPLDTPLKEMI